MNIFSILQCLLLNITVIYSLNVNFNTVNLNTINTDLKRFSLLSKLIYDYDYVHEDIHNYKYKEKFKINTDKNVSQNITLDFIKKNNIYFNLVQFITFLNGKDFIKSSEKYFDLLNNFFPDLQIYGYFYTKKNLHSIILLNTKNKEIIVVFRGSQTLKEWINNLKFEEKTIPFKNQFKIHKGLYNMYANDNIDNNIIYILKNLFDYFPKYRKIFTGHSKGNIISILLSLELEAKLDKKYNYEIFGFGSPLILNYPLAEYLHTHPNIKIYNTVNYMDFITILPFKNKFHAGTEILLKDNKMCITEHEKPYKICQKSNLRNIFKSICSHDLNKYIKNIFHDKI